MIATLHLRLPELDAHGASRLAAVDAALAKYSPDQPRDWHGRWTAEGGDGSGSDPDGPVNRPPAHQTESRSPSRATQAAARATRPRASTADGDVWPPAVGARPPEPSDVPHLLTHPTGGHLIEAEWQQADADDGESPGFGDNSGARLQPEGNRGLEPDPDPALPTPKVPPGWDQPYRVINGVGYPAGRYPKLPGGRPWPPAEADVIYRMLDPRRGARPYVKLYVPIGGKGPTLMGTREDGSDYIEPSGYQTVFLRGIPQRTASGGADTAHALRSVEKALELAETNEFSDIYFNRSFSTISDGRYDVRYRGDVVGFLRPTLDGEYDVHEVLSPGQSGPAREQMLRPLVPGIRNFSSQTYKLLLKLLRALGVS